MLDDVVLNKIISIISEMVCVDGEMITIESDIKNVPGWDSLNHVLIVMKICEGFSLEFSQDLILNFTSVRKIYNYVKRRKT